MNTVRIEIATEASPALLEGVRLLLRQLSSSALAPTVPELQSILDCSATHLFIATDGNRLFGMLTLVLVRTPSGTRAHIEDVVVAVERRRHGLGKALARAALEFAKKSGARTIDLTSRPERKAAIRLYERLGFQKRDTNVFRYSGNGDDEEAPLRSG